MIGAQRLQVRGPGLLLDELVVVRDVGGVRGEAGLGQEDQAELAARRAQFLRNQVPVPGDVDYRIGLGAGAAETGDSDWLAP